MADKKISALTASSTPLAGTEVLPIVQGGSTVKVSVANLTAGRVVSASGAAVNATFKAWSVVNAYQVGTGASFGGGVGFADGFATCNSYYDGSNWKRIVAAGASQVALTPSTGLRFNIAGSGAADSTMSWTEVGSFSALADFTVNSGNIVIGTTAKGITTGSAIPLGFGVNNTVTALTIDTASNVGVGTASPATRLHAQSSASNTTFRATSELSGSFYYSGFEVNRSGTAGGALMRASRNAAVGGAGWEWLVTADNGAEVSGTYTSAAVIDNYGNFGVNELAPNYKLDVNGSIGFNPGSSVAPVDNGDVVFELTNNTTLTVKARGSDGVERSATITLT